MDKENFNKGKEKEQIKIFYSKENTKNRILIVRVLNDLYQKKV